MKISDTMRVTARRAREASHLLATLTRRKKDEALARMADELRRAKRSIINANERDVRTALRKKKSAAFIDRLTITEGRFRAMVDSIGDIIALSDPVGERIETRKRPNGLRIDKVRVPIGVVAIIYESRPNVTVDCASLCFKSGNAVILRGGSDSLCSNRALFVALRKACVRAKVPAGAIHLVTVPGHDAVRALLQQSEYIDVVIPRGGESLIREVADISRIPVIKHYKGVCHLYVDEKADLAMAERLIINAKCQRPGVCNAIETLLVNRRIAGRFLPRIIGQLRARNVEVRGCPVTRKIVPGGVRVAHEEDWYAEYLDLILAVRVVRDTREAIEHITKYGSQHSDGIITGNKKEADLFTRAVDSACVYVNASTRFTDGGQFGMGAEIGISTDKLHARGPMGLAELCTYKYVIHGTGQIRK